MGRLFLVAVLMSVFSIGGQAQTCRDDVAATAPDSRFQDNGDGTVTDLWTGLIWKQCAEGLSGAGCATGSLGSYSWHQAFQHATDHIFAGHSNWRLPNKNELVSLVERRCYGPAINSRFFPNTPSDTFWSSSPGTYFAFGPRAWFVNFASGTVDSFLDISYLLNVRLVCSGQ